MAERWIKRIARAEREGRFDGEALRLAGDFQTCAVGELHPGYRSSEHYQELVELGVDFCSSVDRGMVSEAREIYDRIEELSRD